MNPEPKVLYANGRLTILYPVRFGLDGELLEQEVEFVLDLRVLAGGVGRRACQGRSGKAELGTGLIEATRLGHPHTAGKGVS